MYCPKCGTEMRFHHTDYYDFEVFICPECGEEDRVRADFWLDDEGLMALYGDDYFDDIDWNDGEE